MGQQPLSEEIKRRAYEAVKEFGSISEAARQLKINRMTFEHHFRQALAMGWPDPRLRQPPWQDERDAAASGKLGFKPVLPGFAIKTTSAKTEDGVWVKQVREAGDEFEVPEGHRVKGISALVDQDERVLAKWVKTVSGPSPQDTVEAIKAAFSTLKPAPIVKEPGQTSDDLLTVLPVADLHLGLYSYAKETGDNYDLKIAQKLSLAAVRQLVAASPPSGVAIVLDLGDFFHADDSSNQTARSGHALDVDTRFSKVLEAGVHLSVAFVEAALQRHKRVIYRKLPGNHDSHTSVALALALAAYYRNNRRVTVDTDPSRFFFYQHGTVMLAATHGDMCKPEQMPGFAASARAEMWGACKTRYAFFGHVHHRTKRASEMNGMYVETFGTLAAKDAWHAGQGFSSQRSMSAITYHKKTGEKSRNIVNL